MKVKKAKVPIEIRRLVANHLESIRDNEMGSKLKEAHIGEDVYPIYRPDLKNIAYYQFELKSIEGNNVGFFIVSNGEHDFPIPHWSSKSLPISEILINKAKDNNKKGNKIYKVDALAYILEDANGDEASSHGTIPGLLEGVPENLADYSDKISASESVFDGSHPNDDKFENIKHRTKNTGSRNKAKYTMTKPKSWGELKSKYAKTYKAHLDVHKQNAKEDWDIEKLVRKFGEGIYAGKPFRIPFLSNDYSYKVIGNESKYVTINILKRTNGPDVAEILCKDPKIGKEGDFSLQIKYSNNEIEKLDFFIVSENTPSNKLVEQWEGN